MEEETWSDYLPGNALLTQKLKENVVLKIKEPLEPVIIVYKYTN